jgi:hypothetical protein
MADEEQSQRPPTGFPEPPGKDPGDHSGDPTPHTQLNNPASDPDPTEWPDPYDKRDDPRDGPDADGGAQSTSEPHPSRDHEAFPAEPPERDKLDQ